jgi:hypothetical protein
MGVSTGAHQTVRCGAWEVTHLNICGVACWSTCTLRLFWGKEYIEIQDSGQSLIKTKPNLIDLETNIYCMKLVV